MSSWQFNHIETDLLAKALKFSITSKTLPNKNIATMEDVVKDLEKRRGWQNSCQKSLKLQHPIPPKDKHSKDEHKA